ncbi:molecular chaperone DnaJ [Nostoc linckia z18]|jgi:curved DNA-binding protein CbpA|uniref:Molecular chaperone DnaJ n=2 Tax=Nostoc linckia TaxID=92942 RepID=A0A9Q5ZFY3_NOSLI|nr:J domain-containing protein [Nostoc linckia]PHK38685.1 molecular chaperone DnaJ [Nostoc linckia z15]PHK43901.1 molecular chaperone DnaJ [Nostoc linckia z16]PHJ63725.1 molecular chaperone DnaJ [Nostoc linckia z1]PHJ69331.1 molecular chaperone DnaJ [Nostoc linckia z3]PHJ72460.1 molecular chaperone DnaJ [Nostoc linckia z2]
MSFKIDRGLFRYDFIDHHAVLCVPVDADVKDIRKRYLQIARRLHPDSSITESAEQKQLGNELLSKLVNPAYEKLANERTRTEYILILSQMGKRLVQESTSVTLYTELGRQLANAPNIDHSYKSAIAKLAPTQYDSLEQALQVIAQISELNLVYLMRSAVKTSATTTPQLKVNSAIPKPDTAKQPSPAPPPAPTKEDSVVEQYVRRAQSLIDKNQFAQAKVELQEALKLEPKNSHCHSLMGMVYLKQNQLKMAKIHFDNALKLDPNDQIALQWKPKIDKALGQQPTDRKVTSSPNNGDKQPDKSGNGGLFGGLFGGKKK